jgi:hypothetical protein
MIHNSWRQQVGHSQTGRIPPGRGFPDSEINGLFRFASPDQAHVKQLDRKIRDGIRRQSRAIHSMTRVSFLRMRTQTNPALGTIGISGLRTVPVLSRDLI